MQLGLLPKVGVVSTVSGGSLFGGAWMAARARGDSDEAFLEYLGAQIQQGFIIKALASLHALKLLWPGFNRTDRMAEVFDTLFCRHREGRSLTLADLPEYPRLCINTTVVNHGQVGKFSREGFSTENVRSSREAQATSAGGSSTITLDGFKLSRAVAASAAFPIGLPPLTLSRKKDLAGAEFSGSIAGHTKLTLTDGGVLENLGIQTLLKSHHFNTWDLIISDAGIREGPWQKGTLSFLTDMALPLISGGILKQLLVVMNNKQNRWMRFASFTELEESWLKEELRGRADAGTYPALGEGLKQFIHQGPRLPRRQIWFVRVNQSLENLIEAVPDWRLVELWERGQPGTPLPAVPQGVQERLAFLERCGVDLSMARKVYDELGGRPRADELNRVATNWTGLSERDVRGLEQHGLWQVLAAHALYGSQARVQ